MSDDTGAQLLTGTGGNMHAGFSFLQPSNQCELRLDSHWTWQASLPSHNCLVDAGQFLYAPVKCALQREVHTVHVKNQIEPPVAKHAPFTSTETQCVAHPARTRRERTRGQPGGPPAGPLPSPPLDRRVEPGEARTRRTRLRSIPRKKRADGMRRLSLSSTSRLIPGEVAWRWVSRSVGWEGG